MSEGYARQRRPIPNQKNNGKEKANGEVFTRQMTAAEREWMERLPPQRSHPNKRLNLHMKENKNNLKG